MFISISSIMFRLASVVLVISASMVVISNHAVFSLLFLVLCFIFSSFLLFLLECEFLALVFIVINVGAIAVLFLFAVMMLNSKKVTLSRSSMKYLPAGLLIGLSFLAPLLYQVSFNFKSENLDFVNNLSINWYDIINASTDIAVFGQVFGPITYSLLKAAACEFKAGCLWTLDFVFEVLSKCFAWGVPYRSIFKILFNIWWLTNILALPGAAPFLSSILSGFCVDVVGFYSTAYTEVLNCFSVIRQDVLDILGLLQQNQVLAEQVKILTEQVNLMTTQIELLNQKCLENKLVLGGHEANPIGFDYLDFLHLTAHVLLFSYYWTAF